MYSVRQTLIQVLKAAQDHIHLEILHSTLLVSHGGAARTVSRSTSAHARAICGAVAIAHRRQEKVAVNCLYCIME